MKILTDRAEALKAGYITKSGGRYFIFCETGESLFLPVLRFDLGIDLAKLEQFPFNENPEGIPTLNELVAEGKVKEATIYREAEVNPEGFHSCRSYYRRPFTKKLMKDIISVFKKEGFNVTEEAVMHNLHAWISDLKSGYRDDKNGYHLFTPCGCNPLSFRVSSLEEGLEDWQTTYAG